MSLQIEQDIKEQEKPKKSYAYEDLIKFETVDIFSGVGKQRTSNKISAPVYGIGKANRDKQLNVSLTGEFAKKQMIGKQSPGPQYQVRGTDNFRYKRSPTWHQGTQVRNTLDTGPKFDHYLRPDLDFNPHEADIVRKEKAPLVRIGLENRFPNEPKRFKSTPGPQYNPQLKPEIENSQKYSFGFRRDIKGFSPLILNACTPNIVGPGSYIPKEVPKNSHIEDEPKYSIPKAVRFGGYNHGWDKNQTYDTRTRAIGQQINSKKQTLPQYSIGRGERSAKRGFSSVDMSTQPVRIRVLMPQF